MTNFISPKRIWLMPVQISIDYTVYFTHKFTQNLKDPQKIVFFEI